MQKATEIVSVILPTFKRPMGLKKALESLLGQSACGKHIEVIVADNDPVASARLFIEQFRARNKINIRYISVPETGVANVRNAALKAARGQYLAFLDDDQVASSNWLSEMMEACISLNACLVFCPTYARSGMNLKYKEAVLDFSLDVQTLRA